MTNDHSQSNRFTCCLIGGDTLLTQCGEQLLEAGHTIARVITDAPALKAWANGYDIEVIPVSSEYAAALHNIQFDYLFAITHLALIPDKAIAAAGRGAFNFHDGPLPHYAGLNTPMWALLNGEQSYSITWHVMAEGIDTGDVVITEPVPISEEDSAVSLNTKCFTAALNSFPRLLDALSNDTLAPQPQNLDQRQYFGRADHPADLCLIDWQRTAQDNARFVRALNTGRYENPLGAPKVLINGRAVIVTAAKLRDDLASAPAGTIVEVGDQSITVACNEQAIELQRLEDLSGASLSVSELQATLGTELTIPADLQSLSEQAGSNEHYWVRRLVAAEAIALPYRSAAGKAVVDATRKTRVINVPSAVSDCGAAHIAAAVVCFLARVTGNEEVCVAFCGGELAQQAAQQPALLQNYGVDLYAVDQTAIADAQISALANQLTGSLARGPWLRDLIARHPDLRSNAQFAADRMLPVLVQIGKQSSPAAEVTLLLDAGGNAELQFMPGAYDDIGIERLVANFSSWLQALAGNPAQALSNLDVLGDAERDRLLHELNDTSVAYDDTLLMHSEFERRATEDPHTTALICNGRQISYGELNARADHAAAALQSMGVGPDTLVGVYIDRSIELMVATLGVLKAGAAYVPLDPAFPTDRIEFMIEDSAMPIVMTHSDIRHALPHCDAQILLVDQLDQSQRPDVAVARSAESSNLSYVIYTSGSTGKPKGVMLEHRNVVNFYVAMDDAVPGADMPDRTWMAVTSLSFDISVLELFWTLNRGFKVIIHDESGTRKAGADGGPTRVLDMGLFMWGNDDAAGAEKYRLLMEGARFFDENGFSAVWTPERHFHAFGGPYPNPAVTGAAVAAITENVKIRAGSCVVPLHHPVRIAEEWGVVDNLSNGRVELAAASGWNPNDFVLKPENHAENKKVMYAQLEQVVRLWRGEKVEFDGPMGPVEVQSLPRPVQAELPCWITTAGNPDTWQEAGKLGHHVLTHLLGQSVEEIAEKIRIYRDARAEAGFDPAGGRVALMLHTFVGEDDAEVKELVREPMKDYLSSSMRLAMDYAWAFPAFKRPGGDDATPDEVDLKALNDEEVDTILEFAFERYFETSGLFGTQARCLSMVARCAEAGVDEIACLLDFGIETPRVLDSLPRIKSLRDAMANQVEVLQDAAEPLSFAEQIEQFSVTHLQCTPSTARMYLTATEARQAYAKIPHLLLGGEALPVNLAAEIRSLNPGTLTNMYGPTETTIWSMTSAIEDPSSGITIGKPIANTSIYVLDKHHNPVPVGIPGELFIGGDGVARGYLNRAELTAERFVPDPFVASNGARMYATGDLAMHRPDGNLEYLGRTDFQVKVRGYRIELGEIEARLEGLPEISEAAVMVRAADAADMRLVAYATVTRDTSLDAAAVRNTLRASLPEYMIPNEIVPVQYMPRTANGKLDRKALADIQPAVTRRVLEDAVPSSDLEKQIAELWRKVLKLDSMGLNENFFDLGGHSLLVVQLHGLLKENLDQSISLTDLYQYTTIRSICDYLILGADDQKVKESVSRGEQRRALRRRRAS